MTGRRAAGGTLLTIATLAFEVPALAQSIAYVPANGAAGVNPDTHLTITCPGAPTLGGTGTIRIYDAAGDNLVDTLDLAIPPGPTAGPGALAGRVPYTPVPYEYTPGRRATNADTVPGTPSGVAVATPRTSQLTIIGGFTDAFHFHPVIVHDNVATIYPHNDLLTYGRTYYVQIDPGVLTCGSVSGLTGGEAWRFSTKRRPPAAGSIRLVVAADGTGDFNTVQGALDFVPDRGPARVTIFVRDGDYEEIVYARNKSQVTIVGEDRDKVQIHYANSEVFNPHPSNVATNEWPGTFPSRRAAFMLDQADAVHLVNLTIRNTARGQAEGLLITGQRNVVSHVSVYGSGDALQVNGSVYVSDSLVVGDGDTILGRGPAFFRDCELQSRGPFMWTRNTSANHGTVLVNCRLTATGGEPAVIARAPTNGGRSYPNAEVVLLSCTLDGISPAGWGEIGGDPSQVRYWEYDSRNARDGSPADVSARGPASKQLNQDRDAQTIADYRDPAWVLGGWSPAMTPTILGGPASMTVASGQSVTLKVTAAAIPDAAYEWFKNGAPIAGATGGTLTFAAVRPADAGTYAVTVTNRSGTTRSKPATLTVKGMPSRIVHGGSMQRRFSALMTLTLACLVGASLNAQKMTPTGSGNGGSPHVRAEWTVDTAAIAIEYGRPSLKGRPESQLMPPGQPWRTGADQATTITSSKALTFGTLKLAAGTTYTINTVPGDKAWELVLGKLDKPGQWGIPYQAPLEIGRVPMSVVKTAKPVEQLTISIDDTQAGGTLRVEWGTVSAAAPFKVG